MKKFMLTSAVVLLASAACADTYPYLSFMSADGTVVSLGVESLQMTFAESGDKLVASNGTESRTMNVADLKKMYFSSVKTTGISEIAADSSDMQLYSVSGTYLGKFENRSDIENNVDAGVYIVKSNGKTTKIAVR